MVSPQHLILFINVFVAIHFGNPFTEKRGDSIVPEHFEAQRPSTPPSSPPHDDAFEFVEAEGEGEAAFTGKISRNPRHASSSNMLKHTKPLSQAQDDQMNIEPEETKRALDDHQSNPPPPPPKAATIEVPKHRPPSAPATRKPAPPSSAQLNKPKPAPPKRQNSSENPQHSHAAPPPPAAATVDLQNPNQKPNIKLPPAWMCVWSKSQKRWYFFNTTNNRSVWEWPPPGGAK